MKTVIRTANIKLKPDSSQCLFLNNLLQIVTNRASDILKVFFSLRGESVDIRDSNGCINTATFNFKNQEMGKSLYAMIVKSSYSRILRSPFVNKTNTVGNKSQQPLQQQLKAMTEQGLLPLELANWELDAGYDYAAFQMALSALRSWADRNDETCKNYEKQVEVIKNFDIKAEDEAILDKWLESNNLTLTRKVVSKFNHFGWITRLRNYNFDALKAINSDVEYWKVLFNWKVECERLAWLRPTAAFSMPDMENSPRAMPFGKNYKVFDLKIEKDDLTLEIDNQKIATYHSNYFRNFEVKKNGTNYDLSFERGNNSPLDEKVVADLKEITIFKRKGEFFLSMPFNLQVPCCDENAQTLFKSYISKESNPTWVSGVKVMGVDLGISDPAACVVTESIALNEYKQVGEPFVIGKTKDESYYRKLNNFQALIKEAYEKIGELQKEVSSLIPFTDVWLKMVQPVAILMKELKATMNQLRRFDIYKSRRTGVNAENLKFICVYKKYIGVLQRWTYFGTKPAAKGQSRPKFIKHYRYLNNLKNDFRKKLGCEIVRHARQNNVSVIVLENLEYFLPDQENKSDQNELLMLWGSGQIKRWVNHFAEQYGIMVVDVDPRYTSQIDAKTGLFGVRDKYDRRKLYVEREGKIEILHANNNAAENIAKRFHCRHLDMPSIDTIPCEQGYALHWTKKVIPSEPGERHKFIVKELFGNKLIINKQGQSELVDKNVVYTHKRKTTLYKYCDGWWTREIHQNRKSDMLARVTDVSKILTPV